MQQTKDTQFESAGAAELAQDSEWWNIYEGSFPPEEREPASVILDSVYTGVGLAFRARHGGATVGIATTHLLLRPAAVFLVYLAVENHCRDAGTGGGLFEYLWSKSAAQLSGRGLHALGLIWEVEPPGAGACPSDNYLRRRRISFFEKHGGALIPRPYRQPPVNGPESVPMCLMYRPAAIIMPDSAAIASLVRAIYFEKYAAVNRIPAETLERLLLQSAGDRI